MSLVTNLLGRKVRVQSGVEVSAYPYPPRPIGGRVGTLVGIRERPVKTAISSLLIPPFQTLYLIEMDDGFLAHLECHAFRLIPEKPKKIAKVVIERRKFTGGSHPMRGFFFPRSPR